MAETADRDANPTVQDVALIIGGGPGISASCARLFAKEGMRVAIAARSPDKPVLLELEKNHGVRRYACDASEPADAERLFKDVVRDLGTWLGVIAFGIGYTLGAVFEPAPVRRVAPSYDAEAADEPLTAERREVEEREVSRPQEPVR